MCRSSLYPHPGKETRVQSDLQDHLLSSSCGHLFGLVGWRAYLVEELKLSRAGGDGRFVSCSRCTSTLRSALALSPFPRSVPFVRLDHLVVCVDSRCVDAGGEGVDSATTTYPMVKVQRNTVCYYSRGEGRACDHPCVPPTPTPPHPPLLASYSPPGALRAIDGAGMPRPAPHY